MADSSLTFDQALTTQCEHGIPKVIICPKCEPEKYVLTPQEQTKIEERLEAHWAAFKAQTV